MEKGIDEVKSSPRVGLGGVEVTRLLSGCGIYEFPFMEFVLMNRGANADFDICPSLPFFFSLQVLLSYYALHRCRDDPLIVNLKDLHHFNSYCLATSTVL
jgi:hypothetical protein